MTDETTTQVVPEWWISAARDFQDCFGQYFPNLVDDVDDAGREMDWLYNRVHGNPIETVRRSKARDELAKIRTGLNLMARHDMSYWMSMNFALSEAIRGGDEGAAKADEILKFLFKLQEWQEKEELDGILNCFFAATEKAIEATPDSGNINWDAVHAVEGLRALWWRNTLRHGPTRALNPASRFASFLKDGFEYLEIEGDHLSAFRRWATTLGRRAELEDIELDEHVARWREVT
ncbi:hypothetical protein QNJ95_24380 [Bradyrhizobium elkanii]|uniref:hypothetical protein n=1 Tax=Bradyrhizobium elkanii TaxID=29448 RepID=UPI002711E634|nr:hypothetical protein [Bradyrhizobium elkanii]WLA36182.1 hypothetical protein QNJ95_24380 [Bradyrhizobium elkanii]